MATPLTDEQRRWRTRIFLTTWFAYFGFYFCRTPFSATKADIGKEAHWSASTLGDIDATYLIAYAMGQFLASGLGTKLGPRKNVLIGMILSIGVTLAMGVTLDAQQVMMLVGINGLAQATGWSGNVGTMANWYHKHERGRVMGLWSTNFTVGSIGSTWTMALVLYIVGGEGWRWCFYVGAAMLGVVLLQFFLFQRTKPEDVGLAPVDDPKTEVDESKQLLTDLPRATVKGGSNRRSIGDIIRGLGLSRDAWINLFLVGGFYFFSKLIRYAIWGWAAYFLTKNYLLTSSESALASTAFAVAGLPGVYLTGYISDKYLGSRRAGISTWMMLGMVVVTGLLILLSNAGVGVFILLLACVGFTLFGPDALLSGAGAIDIGGRKAATFAAGFISGLGSLGPVVQAVVIGRLYDAKGGNLTPIFVLLFASAALATLFCGILVLRNRSGGKGI